MSGQAPKEPAGPLFRRRIALGLHLVFQLLVVIGSQGPWYQPTLGGRDLGDQVTGRSFVIRREAPALPSRVEGAAVVVGEEEPAEPAVWERPGFLGTTALLAAVLAFFFVSYDLVTGSRTPWPALLASLVVVGCAWVAYRQVASSQALLDDVIREVKEAGLAPVDSGGPGPALAAPVPVPSLALEARTIPGLRLCWGAALFLAAAPQLLIVSLYLTFISKPKPAERP